MADQKKAGGVDLATFFGLLVGLGAILGGLVLEGGKIGDVAQITAGMIVLGGTLGAVMVATPQATLLAALKRLGGLVKDSSPSMEAQLEEILQFATRARRAGLLSLEDSALEVQDPFLRKALTLAVDGSDLTEIRGMLELEIDLEESRAEAAAKVLEGAGGYAPTIGIIGAVMGLIQVMKNLADIKEVGHGIAVAFVATVYGVGLSNLFFLPAAQKLKAKARAETHRKELIVEGISGIVEGLNPKLLRSKLEPFLHHSRPSKVSPEPAAVGQPVADEA
ncbi:MAG: flagellar motor protein [Acidobacteriota bacterium]